MPTLPSELIARVAAAFGLTPADLTGPSRARRHFAARAAAAWLLRQRYPDLGLVAIGRLLGGRDHTTVMNAIARAAARLDLILRVLRHGPRLDEDPGAFARHVARALDEVADALRASAFDAADLAGAPDWLLALPDPQPRPPIPGMRRE